MNDLFNGRRGKKKLKEIKEKIINTKMEKSSTIVSTQEGMMSTTTDDVKVLVFDAYKPKPCSSFLEAAIRALFNCFGAEKIEQVAECPATTTETPVADTPVSDDPPANPEAAPSPPVETNPESSKAPILTSSRGLSDGSGGKINSTSQN
ncbi:uncharacterized protein LOC125470166 [Pyrus x bretschneideri]|uniref:uncharacterized protein LOC125470166 n=1 Tax=Pyrus x bretschneideri TaxID=225117 RepID=UPI00202F4B1E|nr:uncharacterized protein LOC125470166 [Pyrus x bretschneideri]